MNLVVSAFVVLYSVAQSEVAAASELVNDPARIARLNLGGGWVAGPQKIFDGWTIDDASRLSVTCSTLSNHMNDTSFDSDRVAGNPPPVRFDARDKWVGLIMGIQDQKQCGACWAVASATVLADRVGISTGKRSPLLSAQDLVSCSAGEWDGCTGVAVDVAFDYIHKTGIVKNSCFPYASQSGHAPPCQQHCNDGAAPLRTKSTFLYPITGGVLSMQQELLTQGPFIVVHDYWASLLSYQRGIYQKRAPDTYKGCHAAKLVGWGVDYGTSAYWMVANSWGDAWGRLRGYYRVRRGFNECGIEGRGDMQPCAAYPIKPAAADVFVV